MFKRVIPNSGANLKRTLFIAILISLAASSTWCVSRAEELTMSPPQVKLLKEGRLTYVVGSVCIAAPREVVWERLVDYDNAPDIFTNLSLCQVVGTEGDIKLVRQLVEPGGPFKFDYIVNLREEKPRLIAWKRRSGSLEEVTGTWELKPEANGKATKVTYKIHLDGGILLPPWLLSKQVRGYLPKMLNALREKVESEHKDGNPTSLKR
jgi:carbon monoxide dehydrogenase subunit G